MPETQKCKNQLIIPEKKELSKKKINKIAFEATSWRIIYWGIFLASREKTHMCWKLQNIGEKDYR